MIESNRRLINTIHVQNILGLKNISQIVAFDTNENAGIHSEYYSYRNPNAISIDLWSNPQNCMEYYWYSSTHTAIFACVCTVCIKIWIVNNIVYIEDSKQW